MSGIDCAVQNVLNAKQDALQQQISITVAAKQLDAARQQGDAVNALLQEAVQLSKAAGAGENFDAQA
jgi:hypothetical protein